MTSDNPDPYARSECCGADLKITHQWKGCDGIHLELECTECGKTYHRIVD